MNTMLMIKDQLATIFTKNTPALRLMISWSRPIILSFFALYLLITTQCTTENVDSRALAIRVAPGDTLPLLIKWTDVASEVIGEKYNGFTGFTATIEGQMHVVDTTQDSIKLSFELTRFSIDTLRESGTLEVDLSALSEKIRQKIPSTPWIETRHYQDGSLFFWPVTLLHEMVFQVMAEEDYNAVQAGSADYEEIASLYQTIHLFPGDKPKGYQWTGQTVLQREKDPADTLTVSWELLRSNQKELAFYGTASHTVIKEARLGNTDKTALLYRYQYALNPVYHPENRWIKAGTLEIRAESSSLVKEIDAKTGESREISKPFAVRNLRITFLPQPALNEKK